MFFENKQLQSKIQFVALHAIGGIYTSLVTLLGG
jgi:hypothetical protein